MANDEVKPKGGGKRCFSIELSSRDQLMCLSLPQKRGDHVLIDGTLGELQEINIVEYVMLEILCSMGTLRIDLTEGEYGRARISKA